MQNIGLVYKGAMDARPQDEIALGVARINMNNDVLGNRSEESMQKSITAFMQLTG